MSVTTNWADVELELMARARELVTEGVVREVKSATSEAAADKATKNFPSLIFVMEPIAAGRIRATGDGGFSVLSTFVWTVYQYASTGKPDDSSRYGPSGIAAVNTAQREKLLGFAPSTQGPHAAQKDNTSLLSWNGCRNPEPYQGTGALKMASTYSLEQLIHTI